MPDLGSDHDDDSDHALLLKTAAPRVAGAWLARPRLQLASDALAQAPLILLQGGAGDGKSVLLAQWREQLLAAGETVAWLLADDSDEPQRFVRALVQAVRSGAGVPGFGRLAPGRATAPLDALDAMTALMGELGALGQPLTLMVDQADTLPAASLRLLAYLLHNAPPAVRIVLAARSSLKPLVKDLLVYGQCVTVGADLLQMTADETAALAALRLGDGAPAPDLHQAGVGWPLVLQLILAAAGSAQALPSVLDQLAEAAPAREQLPGFLIGLLLARLPRRDAQFLIAASIDSAIHPQLCAAVSGLAVPAEAASRLAALARELPLFLQDDDGGWLHLHPLVQAPLRQRLRAQDEAQLHAMHWRAARWLADQGLLQMAAGHALAASDTTLAFNLVERCLLEAVRQGDVQALEQWRALLPETELARRPRLGLASAWVQALSEQHRECERRVEGILETAGDDTALRYECMLVGCVAALVADDTDRFVAMFAPWAAAPPPTSDPWLLQAHANRLASFALQQGDPAQARQHLQRARLVPVADSSYVRRWSDFLLGHSYQWEGQVRLAQETVVPLVLRADADLGRRHPLAVMFAALLANILFDSGAVDEAAALLADRLDVLGRAGAPDSVINGYRSAARCAQAQGQEHRALDLLQAMHAVGEARQLPRVAAHALVEQLRLHAARGRASSAAALLPRLDALASQVEGDRPLARRALDLVCEVGKVYAAIAAANWAAALNALERSSAGAGGMRMGRLGIELLALRALVHRQLGTGDGRAELLEAKNLAELYGLQRAVADTHPRLAAWLAELDGAAAPAPVRPSSPPAARVVPNEVLTRKENEVLALLANHLSNKEIASALMVGEETVKWHVKNLFGKLDAASRKHVVRRARLLGLLEGA